LNRKIILKFRELLYAFRQKLLAQIGDDEQF